MKNYIFIIFSLLIIGCKTSDKLESVTKTKYCAVYKFKNSKSIVFNDSVTKSWFMRDNVEIPITPTLNDIIILNKKLRADYFLFMKKRYTGFDYSGLSLTEAKQSRDQEKETLKYAKSIQRQMNFLDKQYVCFKDSLARNVIIVKIIKPTENNNDAEEHFIGNIYDLKYNLENLEFLIE